MKEKLLQLLATKFSGVDNVILQRIAEKKSEGIENDEQLNTVVDGIDFAYILQSEADRRVTDATRTAISNYEKKYGLKEGKPVNPQEPKKPDTPPAPPEGENKEIVKLREQISEMANLMSGLTKQVTVSQKVADAKAMFTKAQLPEKWFSRVDVTSETPVEDQIKALNDEYAELKQSVIDEQIRSGVVVPEISGGADKSVDDYKKLFDGNADDDNGVAQVNIPA